MRVRPGCFIPRWETEEWTLALANRLRAISSSKPFTLADLCTGSGCIPLLLKSYVSADIDESLHSKYGKPNPDATFIGIENSSSAIEVARLNLKNLLPPTQKYPDSYSLPIQDLCRTIYFLQQDIVRLPTAAFQGRIDIITCNPPYIPISAKPTLSRSVTKYEPSEALFVPSTHGDEYYQLLLSLAERWSTPVVVMEVGDLEQAERVKGFFTSHQWKSSIWLDSANEGRVVVAIRSENWAFLLPQPNYSIPLDLTPFPRTERKVRDRPGSILSMFERPRLVVSERPFQKPKKEKEKESGVTTFVDRMLERLKGGEKTEGDKNGFIKYLEDLKKISK
jgi:methylase of polypeptide subunit release factors